MPVNIEDPRQHRIKTLLPIEENEVLTESLVTSCDEKTFGNNTQTSTLGNTSAPIAADRSRFILQLECATCTGVSLLSCSNFTNIKLINDDDDDEIAYFTVH